MTAPRPTRRPLRIGLRVLVTLSLCLVLAVRTDWRLLAESLSRLGLPMLATAFGAHLLTSALDLLRLGRVLVPLGPSGWEVVRLHFAGLYFGSFLPGQTGADVYRTASLTRSGIDWKSATSSMILLRTCGLLALLAAAFVSSTLLPLYELPPLWPDRRALLGAAIVTVLLLLAAGALRVAAPRLFEVPVRGARGLLQSASRGLADLGGGGVGRILLLSVGVIVARVGVLSALLGAAGVDLSVVPCFFVVSYTSLATLLPLGIGGLGVRELTLAWLLESFGVDATIGVQTAIIWRAFIVVLALCGSGALLFKAPQRTTEPSSLAPTAGSREAAANPRAE